MHYYKHYIGDYRRDTSHLTLLEHGIYRQLIDSYCLDETPLTNDLAKLMRSHSVRTAEEQQALQNVLTDFFELTENGYVHKRCEKTVAEYHGKSDKARQSANARWHKENNDLQSNNAIAMRTHTEGNANHKPLTINQEPITSSKSNKQRGSRLPDNWWPSAELENWAKAERPELDVVKTAEGFIDYWLSVPGQKGVKLDWDRTFKTWIRNQKATKGNKVENLKLTEHGERAVRVMDSWLKGKESEDGQAKIC